VAAPEPLVELPAELGDVDPLRWEVDAGTDGAWCLLRHVEDHGDTTTRWSDADRPGGYAGS
jgi:hypothetical protein